MRTLNRVILTISVIAGIAVMLSMSTIPSSYGGNLVLGGDVPVDIKPESCPNPLNVNSQGVLPVAILGADDIDVTNFAASTITLEGVQPLRSELEDVATPFVPFIGKSDALDCTDEGPDGFVDLTFKFDTQEIVAALGGVNDGDVLVLQLTGFTNGGNPIQGEDVVIIIKK